MSASHNEPAPGPVERDCICLMRAAEAPHIAECNQRFRAKFFRAWRHQRFLFYSA
jgi:hypothetical protein